ncbi:hypothetical protein ABVT39_010384 [Epinephelus coioides]
MLTFLPSSSTSLATVAAADDDLPSKLMQTDMYRVPAAHGHSLVAVSAPQERINSALDPADERARSIQAYSCRSVFVCVCVVLGRGVSLCQTRRHNALLS